MEEKLETKHFTLDENENVIINNKITNIGCEYECPRYITALLKEIDFKLSIAYWNKFQKEYESPFGNTGNIFINNVFEVRAYDWNNESSQKYNFKCGDVEISWYKYLGRCMTINKKYPVHDIIDMYNRCIESIEEMEDDENV